MLVSEALEPGSLLGKAVGAVLQNMDSGASLPECECYLSIHQPCDFGQVPYTIQLLIVNQSPQLKKKVLIPGMLLGLEELIL